MLAIARVLLTIGILGFSLVPVLADLNRTHATNPLWTGHARYHVVWQVTSYVGLGLLALGLIWSPSPAATQHAWISAAIAAAAYGGFFTAAFTRPLYGGAMHDVNGYQPIPVRLGGRTRLLDINVLAFSGLVLILGVACALLLDV